MSDKNRIERFVDYRGYVRVYVPDHPNAMHKGFVYEHRLVVEMHIGRYLKSDEVIHHKNHIKSDNRYENLEIKTPAQHASEHRSEEKIGKWSKTYDACVECGRSDTKPRTKELCQNCYINNRRKQERLKNGVPERTGKWSKYHDACTNCGLSEHPPRTIDLCTVCYARKRNGSKITTPIKNSKLSDRRNAWAWLRNTGGELLYACKHCGRSDIRHWAHGLCKNCFSHKN